MLKPAYPLLAGLSAAVIFGVGVVVMPLWLPGYSQVRQTVSEIGMVGSPMQVPFTLMLCAVAACLLVFGWALGSESVRAGHSSLAGWLTACVAISAAGVGVFSYPSPYHNLFGLSELIGYQAPLALAITWRADARASVVRMSWLMTALMWVTIILNLSVLDRTGALWVHERPFYGLVQRSLFGIFFLWAALAGVMLTRSRKSAVRPSPAPTSAIGRAR